jgi:hypothetical protein
MVVSLIATATAVTSLGVGGAQGNEAPASKANAEASQTRVDPQAAKAFLANERAASKNVVSTSASRSTLATVQARIAGYVAKHGTRYTFGSYADPVTGAVVLDTDAPADVVAAVTGRNGGLRNAGEVARATVKVRKATTTDVARRSDTAPYWGGAGLVSGGSLCSAGYSVRNSAGTRFMVTAGHCYANGATVFTETGGRTVGTVSGRALASLTGEPLDMELLGGQSYGTRIFTGGVDSTSSIPVVSAGAASVGYSNYCHSGRTTGENCGHTATSTTGQVCTGTGCKSPVIVYTGGRIQQGGDSGGPFYAKNSSGAWIRGHVIASNSTTGYVQPWTQVANRYSVNIVTG